MKKIITLLAIMFVVTVVGNSLAAEISPKLKIGSINWNEGEINEGHKFLRAVGLDVSFNLDNFKLIGGFELWSMGEPLDEDVEIPDRGYGIYAEMDYNNNALNHLTIYPFVKMSLKKFSRTTEGNSKYKNSWNSIKHYELIVGGGINYNSAYLKMGLLIPFLGETNTGLELNGKPGFEFETGVRWKNWGFGWVYTRTSFSAFSDQPKSRLNIHSVIIKYNF